MGFSKICTIKQVIDCRWPFSKFLQPRDIINPLFIPESGSEFPETVRASRAVLKFFKSIENSY